MEKLKTSGHKSSVSLAHSE